MKKTTLALFIGVLAMSFSTPVLKAENKNTLPGKPETKSVSTSLEVKTETPSVEAAASSLYDDLNLNEMGLSFKAMKHAYEGYDKLKKRGELKKNNILTIVDFSQSSRKKRLYIIDTEAREVLMNTYVSHGKNSGFDMATAFSNTPESLQSSLGFFVTKAIYFGKHGLSLRLDGKEKGINCKAEARAIVMHGATYVGGHRNSLGYMGRSFGCPAVPKELSDKIINMIKDGSCLFIYHPSNSYLHGSTLLNG